MKCPIWRSTIGSGIVALPVVVAIGGAGDRERRLLEAQVLDRSSEIDELAQARIVGEGSRPCAKDADRLGSEPPGGHRLRAYEMDRGLVMPAVAHAQIAAHREHEVAPRVEKSAPPRTTGDRWTAATTAPICATAG
jgi:hypothetical protein